MENLTKNWSKAIFSLLHFFVLNLIKYKIQYCQTTIEYVPISDQLGDKIQLNCQKVRDESVRLIPLALSLGLRGGLKQ